MYCLTLDSIKIKDIEISGNSTVSQDEITSIVKDEIGKKDLYFIPTDNFFLFKRFEIPETILQNIKKIKSVNISFSGLNKITVNVTERTPENLWCDSGQGSSEKCYFMDNQGLIFSDAPIFNGNLFPEYFGLITGSSPIGQNYFDADMFVKISNLFSNIKKMNLNPVSFKALSKDEYEVNLALGGKILLNGEQNFDTEMVNLQTLIDNNYIKTDDKTLSKLNYVDLRYNGKVPFLFNK